MTISQSSPQDLPRVAIVPPDVQEFGQLTVFCSLCGQELDDVGTPDVPATLLDVDRSEDVPVFGYRCENHRHERVIVPAPAVIAPDNYQRVDAALDSGGDLEVAIPPVIVNE